jgi:uncharacterized BrkB/YihY/UPF0761 family membrane protein
MKTFNEMLKSKTGSSYWFLYTLAFAFVIGILFIIFNQTLLVYIYPTTMYLTNVSGTPQTQEADKWLGFWGLVPFIIIFVIGIFLFFRLTQTGPGVGE